MAEAIARKLSADQIYVRSAGLTPLGWIAPQTFDALETLGFPSNDLHSKGFEELETEGFDVVVSLLGEQGLDHIPPGIAARREAWQIPDPFGEDEEVYIDVARQLEQRIRNLLSEELDSELFSS
jgi:arsenate reductase